MKYFLLLTSIGGALWGQPFTFGVKGGVRLTGDVDSPYATSESKRYVAGPMLTAKLPLGFRLEFDALYRRAGHRTAFGNVFGYFTERDRGNSWEFPFVIRHTIWRSAYAGAGYAPRTINGRAHVHTVTVLPPGYFESDFSGDWRTTHGVIGAAGIEKRIGPLRIAPEIRYTFWTGSALNEFGPQGFFVQSGQHQVDLLFGISFP